MDEEEKEDAEETVDADDEDDGTEPKQVTPESFAQSGWYYY